MNTAKPAVLIGIDPGVSTGMAVWDRSARAFSTVATVTIVEAMEHARALHSSVGIEIWFEDARQRRGYYGDADQRQQRSGAGIREGVGSVKRDCSVWEEFCDHHKIRYSAIKPAAGATKWDAERFRRVTGWEGRTSEHSRDAGALVWGAK